MDLLLATTNSHKVKVFQSILGQQVRPIRLELSEIQSISVQEVVQHKSQLAYQIVGRPVLVEDTGLSLLAWNELPGALIKWFVATVGNDGICQMLQGFEQTEAVALSCVGYSDGNETKLFLGKTHGHVTANPRGNNGFGWDPIFVPEGWTKTFAEMTDEDESKFTSMRKSAILSLKAHLESISLRKGKPWDGRTADTEG